jgi:hypothetical protein
MKVVFDLKERSGYKDSRDRYHFPNRSHYLAAARAALGDWALIREPQRNRGRRAYVSVARVVGHPPSCGRPAGGALAFAMASSDIDPAADRRLGFERFIFFSDAVFAIAITLLVLDLKPPHGRAGEFDLTTQIPNLIGFGLSFYVVGRYWLAHHALFETVRAYDRRLLVVNLVFLASIAFLPFPTSVVAQEKAETGPVVLYMRFRWPRWAC